MQESVSGCAEAASVSSAPYRSLAPPGVGAGSGWGEGRTPDSIVTPCLRARRGYSPKRGWPPKGCGMRLCARGRGGVPVGRSALRREVSGPSMVSSRPVSHMPLAGEPRAPRPHVRAPPASSPPRATRRPVPAAPPASRGTERPLDPPPPPRMVAMSRLWTGVPTAVRALPRNACLPLPRMVTARQPAPLRGLTRGS